MRFEQLTQNDLLKLTSVHHGPCISLYLPLNPEDSFGEEFEILVRRAAHLLSFDKRREISQALLEAIYNFNPVEFVTPANQGLALFVNKHWRGYYFCAHKLPSKVVVADSFHLKPLLDDIQDTRSFFTLVLTGDEAQLLKGHGGQGQDIHSFLFHQGSHSNSIHWQHQDLSETVQFPHLKVQSRQRGTQDSRFKKKTANKLFLRWIESKINKEDGYKTLPLFVFSSELLFHAYREISTHPHPQLCLLDITKPLPHHESLLKRAEERLAAITSREVQEQVRKNKLLEDLTKISKAALKGKVETLFLRDNSELWGQLHRKSGEITFHEKQKNSLDDDILDDIACEVIRQGGEVIILNKKDMPSRSPAAAILSGT